MRINIGKDPHRQNKHEENPPGSTRKKAGMLEHRRNDDEGWEHTLNTQREDRRDQGRADRRENTKAGSNGTEMRGEYFCIRHLSVPYA